LVWVSFFYSFSGFGVKIAARCPQVAICKYYDEYYSHYYSDFKVTDEVLRRNTVLPQNRIGETCTEHEVNFVCRREDGSYVSSRTMQHVSRIVHEQLTCT
jgi:hypothetical protein